MKVWLIGVGMGNPQTLTREAYQALLKADCIIGASRILESLPEECTARRVAAVAPEKILECLKQNPPESRVCVALSGDVGFYSGAKKLLPLLNGMDVRQCCGVSSVQYFAAALGRPWQNFKLVSAHGLLCDPCRPVSENDEVFFLTGGAITVKELCRLLCEGGLGDTKITVGERLSYEDETITAATAAELAEKNFEPLSVVLAERCRGPRRPFVTPGIDDEAFLRGGAPMTKSEVRTVSLSKLGVCPGDVLYDVGAGTGSVAVEMALLAREGQVYAIETQQEAYELICQNCHAFGARNVTPVLGMAPQAMETLPPPDAAFIGGSKGNLKAILEALLKKNPSVRVAINAIAIETVAEASAALSQLGFEEIEIVQVAVSRAKAVGRYHMMMGQNPVTILSGRGGSHEG